MHLHRSAEGLVVHAPAKLNLFFEVLAKRTDGYHEIETLVYPFDLFDTLIFTKGGATPVELCCRRGPTVRTSGMGLEGVPGGGENLAARAVELLRQRAGIERGAHVRLVKRIPSAAGLGGGSSDAAAALVAANALWELNWSVERLAEVGAELGSDVPLFFARGAAVCRGRGERVEAVAVAGNLHFVVVRPPAGLATAAVYAACGVPEQPRPLGPLMEALARGDLAAAGRAMFNRLESAASGLCAWIGRLSSAMARMDCLGQQMSGSGTCYFGLCRHARHARRVARRLEAAGLGVAFAVQGSR